MNISETIEKLLANTSRIAVVGFSSNEQKAGYYVPAYLQRNGYEIVPVNPFIEEGLQQKAYPDLQSVPGKIDLVLVFRRNEEIPGVVDSAIESGAPAVWMQLGIAHKQAAKEARAAGLDVVMNACMKVEHQRRYG